MPPLQASPATFHQKIASFCDMRLAPVLSTHDFDNLRSYMLGFVERRALPPMTGNKLDWKGIAAACALDDDVAIIAKRHGQHGFHAIIRWCNDTKPAREPVAAAPIRIATGNVTPITARPAPVVPVKRTVPYKPQRIRLVAM